MENRKELILKEVVDQYIAKREPVSSKILLENYDLPFSSATIRNDMHALEEEGFIEKPYTSGGRIPTVKGYRYFVNWLTELSELTNEERREIVRAYEFEQQNTDRLLRNTATLLANVTGYLGFVLSPDLERTKVKHFTLTKLDARHLMAILVTRVGLVENKIIRTEKEIPEEELEQIIDILNDRLEGKKMVDMKKLEQLKLDEGGWYDKLIRDSLVVIKSLLQERSERRLYQSGVLNLLENSPIQAQEGLSQLQGALELVEDKELLIQTAQSCSEHQKGIEAVVGVERAGEMLPYSLVLKLLSNCSGLIGVMGPLEMDYSKSFSAVQYIGNRLDTLLTAGEAE